MSFKVISTYLISFIDINNARNNIINERRYNIINEREMQ